MKPHALAWMVFLGGLAAARGQDGIFADFTTSMGAFTVQLDYVRAPRAVASFVGLATGEKAWADPEGRIWQKPFYDGSIFHRVVKGTNALGVTNGIAIQGGGYLYRTTDTNGVVTTNFAGPGYTMLESITNGLSHSNGVISMANSGPNTDGSQFFITATNYPAWNGGYSVFGRVTTGMSVVAAIAAVAVEGAGERPVADVVLSNVVIRRVGVAAQAFSITNQGLPIVETGAMRSFAAGTNQMLVFDIVPQTDMKLCETDDLQDWETSDWGIYTGSAFVWTTSVPRVALGDVYVFHYSRVRHPVAISSPASQRARKFTFKWDNPGLTYQVTFATNWWQQGTGWIKVGTNAAVTHAIFVGDSWTRETYMGRLYYMDDLAKEYHYYLGFNPGQITNRFTGYWNYATSNVRSSISGTFTME